MEFHLLPHLSSFPLVLVMVASHAYSLTAEMKDGSSTDLGESISIVGYESYGAVYGTPQKTVDAHKDIDSKITGYGSYDLAYGTPQETVASSTNAHKHVDSKSVGYGSYDLAYGTPQKTEGSSINTHKDVDPKSVGYASYDLAYGTPKNPDMEQGHQVNAAENMFLEKDMHLGTKMMVRFTKTSSATHFLPHQVAESIPFSSDKLSEILNRFSVKENTLEAKVIENTIKECERPAMEGEDRYCARSRESLIDFSTSRLGRSIRMILNIVEGEYQEYRFEEGVEMIGNKSVVCHQLNYPYTVALCHTLPMTTVYRVPLVGANGIGVKALAICHEDTSNWAPNAPAFRVLNVKPGTLPICHFIPSGHFIWVPK